jgi:hypothetical protein
MPEVVCTCGATLQQRSVKKHFQSKKHQKDLNKLKSFYINAGIPHQDWSHPSKVAPESSLDEES